MDQIDDKDGTATAMQKFGSNLARSIGGGARAGFMGGRALIAKSRADREKKKLERHDDLQNRRKRIRDREDMYGKKRDAKIFGKGGLLMLMQKGEDWTNLHFLQERKDWHCLLVLLGDLWIGPSPCISS